MGAYFVAINEYYKGKNQRYGWTAVGEAIKEKDALTLPENMAGDSGAERLRTPETLSGPSATALTSPKGIALWFSAWATRVWVYFVAIDE